MLHMFQAFSTILTSLFFFSHADGVLLFNNDDVLHHITAHSGMISQQKPSGSISLRDMNSYISASLAGVLQPLGNKPKWIKGKSKERGSRVVVDKMKDEKRETNFNYHGKRSSKTDSISKKLSYSLDESLDISHSVGSSRYSAMSFRSDDSSVDMSSFTSDFGAHNEMAKKPRSTASALLRYRGIVSPSSSKTRTSNADGYQPSQLAAGVSSGNEPWEMLRSICEEPSKKFATVHHIAKSKVSWEALAQSLIHSIRRYDRHGTQFASIYSLLVARGDHDGSFAEVSPKIEEKLRHSMAYVEWNPFPVDFWISE